MSKLLKHNTMGQLENKKKISYNLKNGKLYKNLNVDCRMSILFKVEIFLYFMLRYDDV